MQLNLATRTILNLTCYSLIFNREFKLIRLNRRTRIARIITSLNHLAFISFEDKSLILKVINITLVYPLTIDKEELEELTGNIDILSDEPMEATVVDMMGKNLAKIVVKGSVDMTEKLKTMGLQSGVYAIRFNNGKSQLVIMK